MADNNDALVQDYLMTIESMQKEVASLKEKLSTLGGSDDYFNFSLEDLQEELENNYQEIESLNAELIEKSSNLMDLQSEKDWALVSYPQAEGISALKLSIENIKASLYVLREKKSQEDYQLSEIEKLKLTKPPLYNLIKKAVQSERKKLELENGVQNVEEERKNMRLEYAKITTALGLEEKVRKRIKEIESEVLKKKTNVDALRKNLGSVKKQTRDTIESIENSTVKTLVKKINDFKIIRAYYADEIRKMQLDVEETEKDIDITSKNPKKIPPAVANQNLRSEVKGLEVSITERSKEIKEKEREKSHASFKLEETNKQLVLLRQKAELIFNNKPPQTKAPEKIESPVKAVNPLIAQKKIEAKRDSVLGILGQGITEGMTKEVLKVLKGVGQPNQGIASKVLELNRSQFNQGKAASK